MKSTCHKKKPSSKQTIKIYITENSREIFASCQAILLTTDILVCSILQLNAICSIFLNSGSVYIRMSFTTITRLFIAEVDKIQRVSGPNTVSILLTEVYKSYNRQYRYDRIKQAWIIYLRSNACGSQNKHIDFCKKRRKGQYTSKWGILMMILIASSCTRFCLFRSMFPNHTFVCEGCQWYTSIMYNKTRYICTYNLTFLLSRKKLLVNRIFEILRLKYIYI